MADVYKVDGRIEQIDLPGAPDSRERLKKLQELVDGSIELVYLNDGRILVINEEGGIMEPPLPLNAKATGLVMDRLMPGDYIKGVAVLLKPEEIA